MNFKQYLKEGKIITDSDISRIAKNLCDLAADLVGGDDFDEDAEITLNTKAKEAWQYLLDEYFSRDDIGVTSESTKEEDDLALVDFTTKGKYINLSQKHISSIKKLFSVFWKQHLKEVSEIAYENGYSKRYRDQHIAF